MALGCCILALVCLRLARDLSAERRKQRRRMGRLPAFEGDYRLLVEGIKDYAIVLMDPQGRITSWNPGAERIKGYASAEILGQHFSCFFAEEDIAAGKPEEILRQAAANGRSEDEGWRVCKNGQRYFANIIITAFYDQNGTLQGFANVTRDITEQRASQAALQSLTEDLEDTVRAQLQDLRESEARLQGFIRHASAAIAFKGLDGRFLLINPRLELLIGLPARDILGRTNEDLFPPEVCARLREQDRRVLGLREDLQVEEPWTHGDGSVHAYIVHKFPLVDLTGQCWGLGLIYTDITERKQAELAMHQSQKLESLGVLAGGIAHDFNNLLGAMRGNVELALTEATLDAAKPYLEILKGLMAKASEQLRRMLAYSGQTKSSVRVLDLNPLVVELIQLLGAALSKKTMICLDLDSRPLPMEADPPQLQQVVMNLVINASEALGEEGGVIQLRTRLEDLGQDCIDHVYPGQLLRPGPYVALEVSDNGIGMTPEVLKRIFDPFFSTKFTGRGLGLATIHGIVRAHQGGLRVDSEPGLGSTFKLLFPAAPGPALLETPEALLAQGQVDNLGCRGAVLVVDDEEPIRSVMAKALSRAGFATLQARDGREALRLVQSHPEIRLIVMDLTMPNLDGEETHRELRRRGITMPVILCSGFSETDALQRFQGKDLAGFLQKPFGLGTLVELVRKLWPD